jgi:hypothetical protein
MDPSFAVNLALAIVTLALVALALRWFGPTFSRAFSRGHGWRELAEKFATTRSMPADSLDRQYVMIGAVLFRRTMRVGADGTGLYLEPGFPISIALKERLLIPWGEIAKVEASNFLWRPAVTLSIGAPRLGVVTLPSQLFNRVLRPHLAPPGEEDPATPRPH